MSVLSVACTQSHPSGFTLDVAFETDAAITALFGPSGSGKTSVLEAIAGTRAVQRGRIAVGDRVLFDSEASINVSVHKRRLGIVFQDLLLFPHLTVSRNLGFAKARARDGITCERVATLLDLTPLLDRYPVALSGGERQRVAIGRALLSSPELLLLDEPLAALDDGLKFRILGYLERVVGEWDIPTVFVSHGQAEVRRLAEWVVALEGGRVVQSGTPNDVLSSAGALGFAADAAPMNLLRCDSVSGSPEQPTAAIGRNRLTLPRGVAATGTVYVEVAPDSILLSRKRVTGMSARNQLDGHVLRIVPVGGACFVGMDVGQVLWAKTTQSAMDDLRLREGDAVTCVIKTQSLRVMS